MPSKPCLLCGQPPEIKAEIERMAKTEHYGVIVDWLHDQGIPATYKQTQYFIAKFHVGTRLQKIQSVSEYEDKAKIYIGQLLKHNTSNYTIKNLKLCGAGWSEVTKRLHADGLIEAMSRHPRTRWRLLASKKELQAWLEQQAG